MNTLLRISIIIAAIQIVTASTMAQSPLLTNPSNLSQFPSIDQVKAGTKGSDDVDSHARFMAALYRINSIIIKDLVTAPNGGRLNLPPEAESVNHRYSNAITKFSIDQQPPASHDPRYRPLEDKYENDPVFLDSLLTQFFSSKFRSDYYAWVRKPVPQTTTQATAASMAATDPSIAKAKAAKVDLSLFGLELGQAVELPVCPEGLFEQAKGNCVNDHKDLINAANLFGTIFGLPPSGLREAGFDPNFLDVVLDSEHCPDWLSGCGITAILANGRLAGVSLVTRGRTAEKSVNEELQAKYGPPTRVKLGKITPDVGNAFDVHDPEWILPGLRVEYQVITHTDGDSVDTKGPGWVRVITESAYQRILNSKKPTKMKM